MKKQFIAAVAIFAVVGGAQTASASSSAQAVIDWNSLSFQLTDYSGGLNSLGLSWTSKSGSVSSLATTIDPDDVGSGSQSHNNFSTSLSVNTDTLFAQSFATRNGTALTASASSQPGASVASGYNNASASASNSGAFVLTGYGLLLITMDWSVASTGVSSEWNYGDTEWASASVAINGSYNGQFNSGSASSGYSTPSYYGIATDPESQHGKFVMAIFNPGLGAITGTISATASASANSNVNSVLGGGSVSQVPLPAAVWMFGAGLFGFLWQTRRKTVVVG